MKVLIVGGAGYLGGAVTHILSGSNHDLRVYDALLYEDIYLKDVPFVLGDVRDKDSLAEHLAWADTVIWLAAIVGDGACAINPAITAEVNYDAVKSLADTFDGRIIFMSTCSVYGARDENLDETSPTNPLSLYADTKLKAEALLQDKNAIIFRLGTLFGLGDRHSRPRLDLVVNTLTARALSDGRLQVFGGDQYRPLLHVQDAAQAIVDNIGTDYIGVFNLHGENTKIVDLAKKVQHYIPGTELAIVETSFEDSRNYRVSSRKAATTFGFNPTRSTDSGILEIKQLLDAKRIKDVRHHRYTNQGFLTTLNGNY